VQHDKPLVGYGVVMPMTCYTHLSAAEQETLSLDRPTAICCDGQGIVASPQDDEQH
jgi:hypothetical protein